jgi:DNA-binding transcriptional ArsR family regulator
MFSRWVLNMRQSRCSPQSGDATGRVKSQLKAVPMPSTSCWLRSHSAALTYVYIGIYSGAMARAATTTDVFNAIAEPRRRELLDQLADGERSVNELVELLGLTQPLVSKHLRVLREVGAVRVRDDGRRRMYSVDAGALKPIHDWVSNYERIWSERFDALDTVLDELKEQEQDDVEHD